MRGRVSGYVISSLLAVLVCATGRYASAQAPQYAQADIEHGSGIYAAECASCHGANGDAISGVNLRSGQFRRASSDQDLTGIIPNGIPGTGMLAHKFAQSELVGLVAYLRNMRDFDGRAVALGDAGRGRMVFEGKGGCTSCHRVNEKGSRVAPNLSDIGAIRAAGALQNSLVDPSSAMMPINRPVRAVTKDGKVINGRRLNEDTYTVQLLDEQERLVSLLKSDLRGYTILTKSPMASYKDTLSGAELADVLAYLVSLKGS